MRLAVIADVHANLPALEAVLEDVARSAGGAPLLCLGDLVGYNAEPLACLRALQAAGALVVAGNHDVDVLREGSGAGTNAEARLAQDWTRAQLGAEERRYLAGLPNLLLRAEWVAVHGCYLNTLHYSGYVTSTMLPDNLAAVAARRDWPRLALCGHTHLAMCGWLTEDGCGEAPPSGIQRWPAEARAVLVNPGAVGQPRDGDPRAAWALLDLEAREVALRRVPYDLERTARAIHAAGLPEGLAQRLREGR